jgi:hypothetical protein
MKNRAKETDFRIFHKLTKNVKSQGSRFRLPFCIGVNKNTMNYEDILSYIGGLFFLLIGVGYIYYKMKSDKE